MMRALVLGGTGAMGVHAVDELAATGCEVVVTSRSERKSALPGVSYVQGNAHDSTFLEEVLAGRFDVVIDFMSRSTAEFGGVYQSLLDGCGRYVFLSSYRVYSDSPVLTEESPRLLDVVDDPEYLATDEYALAKARCEDLLRASGRANWTIVRPAITYDGSGRFQLCVLESGAWLWRALNGLPVPIPAEMLDKQTTLSWGGDVARMISRLAVSEGAAGEVYTVSTSEHLSWSEVLAAYQEVVPVELVPCDIDEFGQLLGRAYQVRYDRMYDRVVDNSKVLSATGMAQDELTGIQEGLQRELRAYLATGATPRPGRTEQARLDRLGGGLSLAPLLREGATPIDAAKWLVRRIL